MEIAQEQKQKLTKEISEIHIKNKHLLKQMKQLLNQSHEFSAHLTKIIEDTRNKLKKNGQLPEDLVQNPFENISFNLIDSHYLEFDKINNLSQMSELEKLLNFLLKINEAPLDTQKIQNENETLKKKIQELNFHLEDIASLCEFKDEFIEKIQTKFIEVINKLINLLNLFVFF